MTMPIGRDREFASSPAALGTADLATGNWLPAMTNIAVSASARAPKNALSRL